MMTRDPSEVVGVTRLHHHHRHHLQGVAGLARYSRTRPACFKPPCHLCLVNTEPIHFVSPLTACPYLCHPTTTRRPKCHLAQLAPLPNTGRASPLDEPARPGLALRAPETQDGRLRQSKPQHSYCVASRRWKKGTKT
ncbi:hypothetical protein O3P69_018297 [Scylla paramamosain]|uniref:Uncharacterized protein n=1 Tax=Scylla paramamosain TaxID=85552 RepID=A0AAW0TJQ8_SCYPA